VGVDQKKKQIGRGGKKERLPFLRKRKGVNRVAWRQRAMRNGRSNFS